MRVEQQRDTRHMGSAALLLLHVVAACAATSGRDIASYARIYRYCWLLVCTDAAAILARR